MSTPHQPDSTDEPPPPSLHALEDVLGIQMRQPDLLRLALQHKSDTRSTVNNERLEFLGDAVVGLVAADLLYTHFPDSAEGNLTILRTELIRRATLATYARALDLGSYVQMDAQMVGHSERGLASVLAAAYEAVVGAVFLDQGYEQAAAMVRRHMEPDVPRVLLEAPQRNAKSTLQEITQARYTQTPTYQVLERSGPPHDSTFRVAVDGGPLGQAEGEGHSRQEAEQNAAAHLLHTVTP